MQTLTSTNAEPGFEIDASLLVANLEHPDHWLRADVVDRIKLGEDARC